MLDQLDLSCLNVLQELNASSNQLRSIHLTVHMIIPLSLTLTALDLTDNPICDDINYCTEGMYVYMFMYV